MISFILEIKSVRYVSCVKLCTMVAPVAIPMHLADSEATIKYFPSTPIVTFQNQ